MKDDKDTNLEVINLDQFRNRKNDEKRRKTERIFFHNLVSAYGLVGPDKMARVDLIDVSEDGLAIQIPYQTDRAWPTQDKMIPIRLYFSPENYMEIVVDVKNSRPTIEGGVRYHRYGCQVQKDHRSYDAWAQFVGFLRSFSAVSEDDKGNMGVGNF